jgi:hypothetical protein
MQRDLARSLLVHYLKAASYNGPVRVYVTAEVFNRRARLTVRKLDHLDLTSYAVSLHRGDIKRPAVWFNLSKHSKLEQLIDSAAHETVHLRWPSLSHGALFTRRVEALKRDHSCGPKGTRLPEAFK